MAYLWRKLTPEQQAELLDHRMRIGLPWHSPPHFDYDDKRTFLLTAACFEHNPIIGATPERISRFCGQLIEAIGSDSVKSWVVLPNHYHVLASVGDLKSLAVRIGQLHGRTSRMWNLDDNSSGRKVWHRMSDRRIRGARHFHATVNYIHHNPVKHGYVEKWTQWPYSSAEDYLNTVGVGQATAVWREYPLDDYGKGWDDMPMPENPKASGRPRS